MAYYSGMASGFNELLNVFVNACIDQGYTWSDGILSKDTVFVRPYVSTSQKTSQGPGLCIEGGTGKSGSSLVNPSGAKPRIGDIGISPSVVPLITFPIQYKIFIFNDPVPEVYLVIRYGIDRFMHLAFGKSMISGCGVWVSGSVCQKYNADTFNANYKSFSVYGSGGGDVGTSPVPSVGTGFFWQNRTDFLSIPALATSTINVNLDGVTWAESTNRDYLCAVNTVQPVISRLPSNWSSETALLTIQPIFKRPSNKYSIVAEIQHARYLRLDNYEPEQIISLGADRWMVIPFHRKNAAARNGGPNLDHTGTFGMAIRYDGV